MQDHKGLQPFLNAKRDRRDNKAAILWDLRKEIDDASTKKARPFGFHGESITLTRDAFDQTLKPEHERVTTEEAGQLLLSAWAKVQPALEANPTGAGKEPDLEKYLKWKERFKVSNDASRTP